jgi:hypothetical protein
MRTPAYSAHSLAGDAHAHYAVHAAQVQNVAHAAHTQYVAHAADAHCVALYVTRPAHAHTVEHNMPSSQVPVLLSLFCQANFLACFAHTGTFGDAIYPEGL